MPEIQDDSIPFSLESRKREMLGHLAGGVFHDLNNLLTIIQLNAALIEGKNPAGSEDNRSAKEILHACDGAANLTRSALALSRQQKSITCPLEMHKVLQDLIAMLEALVERRTKIFFEQATEELWVRGDSGALDQVFMNLILNAVDAHPKTGIKLTAQGALKWLPDGTRLPIVEILVSDDGDGISAHHMPHLFEAFYTTKAADKGTGLGLHTVKRIVEDHGGWVEVKSMQNGGASFRIQLPRMEPNASVDSRNTVMTEKSVQEGAMILLVEDDAGIRALTAMLLEAEGYRVLQSADGESAFKAWNREKENIQLVFADVVLPGPSTGVQVAQAMKTEKPTLKIVHASGYAQDAAVQGAIFLRKPFPPSLLIRTVKAALASP